MLTASTASLRLAVFASVPVSWFIIFPATDRRGDSAVADGSSGSSVSKEVSPDTSNIRGAKRWSINGCWFCMRSILNLMFAVIFGSSQPPLFSTSRHQWLRSCVGIAGGFTTRSHRGCRDMT
ncbi:uncharacterized protein LOC131158381 isoform X2 [Malania oleifera]|uniref:uncharacterized protein LOC131158381 isoform X2 n=1 Tax=Malania oleifera TaxID=397392 RepID=UPI0025ADDD92|nr:uncharacterized protein LOC131158381 isoform X2 [Malania oleifera]